MNWLRRFMYGRYGSDILNFVLLGAAIVLSFIPFPYLNWVSIALLVISIFRMFSKNIYKRQAENAAFMKLIYKIKGIFKPDPSKKYFRYYKCPGCSQQLRVPKGKGKIMITCPNCKTKFQKKT